MAYTFARIIKLLIFYGIFYSSLAAFSYICFILFLKTLNDTSPKWQLDRSLIGDNPGLTLKPTGVDRILRYKGGYSAQSQLWIEELNTFLEPYNPDRKKSENVQNCYYRNSSEEKKVCDFKFTAKCAPCLPQYNYGYEYTDGGPCVFLKLNKIYGWTPQFYHRDNVPPLMPENIIEDIKSAELRNDQYKVWVDCVPLNPSDSGNLGPIKYYPQNGFDGKYFPYLNVEGYLSPLVAVHFEKPKHGVLIIVECKAWAVNIRHDHHNEKGVVRFGLFVE